MGGGEVPSVSSATATLDVPYYRYRIEIQLYVYGATYITVAMSLI